MNAEELKRRTKVFALRALKVAESLPKTMSGKIMGNQMGRCGISVAANYRAACRARSKAEFVAKLGIVEEEADETLFWLELIEESALLPGERLTELKQEANEIIAITVASIKSARPT